MSRESTGHMFLVAGMLCVVCSILVSSAAVGLRPMQAANKELDRKKNILAAANIEDESKTIDELFEERITTKVVDLATGEYVGSDVIDPETYDQIEASKDPARSEPIDGDADIARIGRREKYSFVYEVKGEGDAVDQYILPVNGKGLWSTLYGFLALDKNIQDIRGITFYQHAETPGLGGEVDNPKWKAQWPKKKAFDDAGEIRIEVLKGRVPAGSPDADYQVDGMSGATITTKGVSQLVRFWLGDGGFKAFLDKKRGSRG